ncbi:MAG: DUF1573 domain-containing protein [Bacteroidaceae bacterium]|nr:DUF1573 domain-containing protein [Bacteroidaceae bacterium]
MKRTFALLFAGLLLGSLSAAAQAVLTFSKTDHNFGKFAETQPQTVEFEFTNTGDKPLVIHQAFASCGCTIPTFSQEPIAPGKKGKVKVVYNGKGKFPGTFKKSITVRSNANNAVVRLYVSGDMQVGK